MPPIYLFDWGDTLMLDNPSFTGPMCDWPEVETVPGAIETVRQLATKTTCCLATNANDSNEQQIRAALERVGLSPYITHIFCSQALGFMKPKAEYFDAIKTVLGCSTQELVMVGDNLEKDVMGAQACGLQAIWFNPTGIRTPDMSINSISSLTQLLER